MLLSEGDPERYRLVDHSFGKDLAARVIHSRVCTHRKRDQKLQASRGKKSCLFSSLSLSLDSFFPFSPPSLLPFNKTLSLMYLCSLSTLRTHRLPTSAPIRGEVRQGGRAPRSRACRSRKAAKGWNFTNDNNPTTFSPNNA